MRIAFLGSETSWYFADLRRAAGSNHTLEPVKFADLRSVVVGNSTQVHAGEVCLNDFDAVLVRTMAPASLEQVVFRMDALAMLESSGTAVVNPPKAIEAAVDKYLTTARLQLTGLPVPETIACQNVDDAMQAMASLGGDVVIKPIFGGEGRGIARLADEAIALRTFKLIAQLGGVFYLQEFIEHEGFDTRLLLIGDHVLAVRRRNPLDWRTNVARGAKAEPYAPTTDEVDLARRAANSLGAPVAGIDLLTSRRGKTYVVEVNAVPGWQALSRATGTDVASLLLNWLADHIGC